MTKRRNATRPNGPATGSARPEEDSKRPLPGRAPWRRAMQASAASSWRERRAPGELLWEWQNQDAHPLRQRVVQWCREQSRPARSAGFVLLAFIAGGTLSFASQQTPDVMALQKELRRTQQQLTARHGELELVRIELGHLQTVHHHSRQHRIPADLAMDIFDIARDEGIDPAVAFSLVRVESGFMRNAISPKGAVGLTQLMPSTARFLEPGVSYQALFDRETNLRIGFRYLRQLVDQYDGDLRLALLAYNRGPTRVDSIRRAGGDPSNGYARAVLGAIE
jgi:soluble lytic murein transglycosylase-like protein